MCAQPALLDALSHFLGSHRSGTGCPADRLGDQLRSGNRWSGHVRQRDSSASRQPDASAGDKARELDALVVVNGGRFQPGNAPSAAVQLFVGAESVWVLDRRFQPLLEIPVGEITAPAPSNPKNPGACE